MSVSVDVEAYDRSTLVRGSGPEWGVELDHEDEWDNQNLKACIGQRAPLSFDDHRVLMQVGMCVRACVGQGRWTDKQSDKFPTHGPD